MKNSKVITVITILSLFLVMFGCSAPNENGNKIFNSVNDYSELMNHQLQESDYSQYSIKDFKKIKTENIGTPTTKLEYTLYSTMASKDVEIFLLENFITNHLEQIRYKVALDSREVKFMGYMLGATMRLLYGENNEEELNEFYSRLQINSPTESMNNKYEYKGDLYRAKVEDSYITVYVTKGNSSIDEENYSNIDETNNELEYITTETNDNYLNESNGKEFFETALCGVTGISSTNTIAKDTEIIYSGENSDYSIEVITNLNNQIKSVNMTAKTEKDCTNFFMAATRMDYTGKDVAQLAEYITKNLSGNYSIIYIGNAVYKLTPNSIGKTLEIIATE